MARDRDRWDSWAVPIAIVIGGIGLRITDRLWLVDLFDLPGLSETGNFVVGFGAGAGWYVFPLLVLLVRKLFRWRQAPGVGATLLLTIFATLGAVAISAFPDRYDSTYNAALDDQVPGFSAGIVAGSVPVVIFGVVIWIGMKVLDRQARRDRKGPTARP